MFKSNLSENARKRINILKRTNDGFLISEEDMKLRGYGVVVEVVLQPRACTICFR